MIMRSYDKRKAVDIAAELKPTAPQEKSRTGRNYEISRASRNYEMKDGSNLPNFATDRSEYLFSAIIERVFDKYDLFLTCFFLGHPMLTPRDLGAEKINVNSIDTWKGVIAKFENAQYTDAGIRIQDSRYLCRISNSIDSESYIVRGDFMPNKLSTDANSNRRLDILRCKIEESDVAYRHLIRSNATLHAEIIRGHVSLFKFTVRWDTRRSGYIVSSPPHIIASKLDVWAGYDSKRKDFNNELKHSFHLCVPSIRRPPSRVFMSQYLEFLQHHLLVGADHVVIAFPFGWNSINMARLLDAFRFYIDSKQVTVQSQSGDGFDSVYSSDGLSWHKLAGKVFQANMCLYMAKGTADYVGIWDVDEFFIPKLPYNSITDVLRAMESPRQIPPPPKDADISQIYVGWKGGRGLADGDGHPYCYLSLSADVIANLNEGLSMRSENPFIGDRFHSGPEPVNSIVHKQYGPQKSILPTRNIYQAGLVTGGSCRLEPHWTGCANMPEEEEFCYYQGSQRNPEVIVNGTHVNFHLYHRFDEMVEDTDIKRVPYDAAVLYHYMVNRDSNLASEAAASNQNLYIKNYFPKVREHLIKSGALEVVETLPEVIHLPPPVSQRWIPFKDVYELRQSTDVITTSPFTESNMSKKISLLPDFAIDGSELVLGAMIERVHESWDLYLTTFFLCHDALKPLPPGYGAERIKPQKEEMWKSIMLAFEKVRYVESGKRTEDTRFYCRISNSNSSDSYVVLGEFVPNSVTPDANANKRTDVFRCKMKGTVEAYHQLVRTNASVHVEILREATSLLNFTVPWDERRVGYLLTVPKQYLATTFDPWKAYDSVSQGLPGSSGGDKIHMCVPGLESSPSKLSLPLYLEFVQHHLLLGVDHMFLAVTFGWGSLNMDRFLFAFKSYIEEGKVSVASQSGDNIDGIYSLYGLVWQRDNVKIFQVNMCLYYAKGVADYVGIWDLDEYFIPKLPYNSIVDVLKAVESPQPITPHSPEMNASYLFSTWKKGRGLADLSGHPLCYYLLSSLVILNKGQNKPVDPQHPWMGEVFSHGPEPKHARINRGMGFKKSILPTRVIFQAGLHMGGACQLPRGFTSCYNAQYEVNEHCYYWQSSENIHSAYVNGTLVNFHKFHNFDEKVHEEDAKRINMDTEAVIYHMQPHRGHLNPASDEALNSVNEYNTRFFGLVMEQLRERGLELLVTIPSSLEEIPMPENQNKEWVPYHVFQELSNIENTQSTTLSSKLSLSALPAISVDDTEVILSSMIERSWDNNDLYLTTFFLCHHVLVQQERNKGIWQVRRSAMPIWSKVLHNSKKVEYSDIGVRMSTSSYYCRISNAENSASYLVPGEFVPNRLTTDSNANRRVDILRCKLLGSDQIFRSLSRSQSTVQVEILRDSTPLLKFAVPWNTRSTGYLISNPSDVLASRYDSWLGFHDAPSRTSTARTGERLHICASGIESPPSQTSLPQFLEYVQHHLLLGADHIFLSARFHWSSIHMARLIQAFKSYIDERSVSISSMTTDERHDYMYSLLGLSVQRDNVKVFHANMCLYYSRGVADYVGIWDVDEFFIPKLPYNSITDVLRAMESPRPIPPPPKDADISQIYVGWKGGRGLADGDGHPYCYLSLSSRVVLNEYTTSESQSMFVTKQYWIGEQFNNDAEPLNSLPSRQMGFKKSILPTRNIFQASLHGGGACKLSTQWTGCMESQKKGEFCYSHGTVPRLPTFLPNGTQIDFRLHHKFDEVVYDEDIKNVDPHTVAVIYHYFVLHRNIKKTASPDALVHQNEYFSRFFPTVRNELRSRGLEFLITLPEFVPKPERIDINGNWLKFREVYERRAFRLNVKEKEVPPAHDMINHAPPVPQLQTQNLEGTPPGLEPDNIDYSKIVLPDYSPPIDKIVTLPSFSVDEGDFALGAVIERVYDSWDLYLDTFFIGHHMLAPLINNYGMQRISPHAVTMWKRVMVKFGRTRLTDSGLRMPKYNYYCRLSNVYGSSESYTVLGEFVPNRLTPDANANRRLDTLRCKIRDSERAYKELTRSNHSIYVEILREELSLMNFTVPWKTRGAGFMLTTPDNVVASIWDPWRGWNPKRTVPPSSKDGDYFYICAPGMHA